MGYRSRSSITKLEKGINDLPQSKVEELAQALDLPEEEEILMLLDLGIAAEGTEALPNHSSRKELAETVTYL